MKKAFLKELKFPSTDHTYFKDITELVNDAIKQAEVESGVVMINTKHTTLGVVVNEIAEPNLLKDILKHTLATVHEDKRSYRASKGWEHPMTDYTHRCQDNPLCDEIDEDYNAACHIRALTFSHPSVTLPVQDGKVTLGKYQQIALLEFDGRDGSGTNPIRQRTVQIWIYPVEEVTLLKDAK